jgi:hypothetical protein
MSRHPQSLEGKFTYLKEIDSKINKQYKKGIRESDELDSLLETRHGLEWEIHERLEKGGRLADEVMDYCFRSFPGTEAKSTALHKYPLVKQFIGQVKKLKGQKALSYREYQKEFRQMETGVISGPCMFDKTEYNELWIPVEELLELDLEKGRWEKAKAQGKDGHDLLPVDGDIFEYPAYKLSLPGFPSSFWKTDHSPPFEPDNPGIGVIERSHEIEILLGDRLVENFLENHKTIEVDIQETRPFHRESRVVRVPDPYEK